MDTQTHDAKPTEPGPGNVQLSVVPAAETSSAAPETEPSVRETANKHPKEKAPDPVLAVLERREEMGSDPFRGMFKWEFLEGMEAAGKKAKSDVLLELFVREIDRDIPDRFLVGKIVDRLLSSAKDFKPKEFWKALAGKPGISAATFARIDATVPAPLYADFRDALFKPWKTDRKALSPEQTEAIEKWKAANADAGGLWNAAFTGAKGQLEETERIVAGIGDAISDAKNALGNAIVDAANLQRTIRETSDGRIDSLAHKLDRLLETIEEKQCELESSAAVLVDAKAEAAENAATLRNEIESIRGDFENEKSKREEADSRRESAERERDASNWDKDEAERSKQGLKNDIADALVPFYEDFLGIKDGINPSVLAEGLKSHLGTVFRILKRKGIPLDGGEGRGQ